MSMLEKYAIDPDERCPCCGGMLVYEVITMSNGLPLCRAYCNNCGGFVKAVPKQKNIEKRTNSTLTHWAYRVKHRYNDSCAICGSKDGVEAHHIVPVKICKGTDSRLITDDNNGIALCKKHHMMVHAQATIPHSHIVD